MNQAIVDMLNQWKGEKIHRTASTRKGDLRYFGASIILVEATNNCVYYTFRDGGEKLSLGEEFLDENWALS